MCGRFALMLVFLAAAILLAQSPPAAVETRHLSLTTSATRAAQGSRVVLNVDVALKPKMHVYAPDQPKDQDYDPIALRVTSADWYRVDKPQYPPSEKLFFAALNETQHVYSKPFRIALPVRILRRTSQPLTIEGTVRYQACDDTICYVPQTVPVKWEIQINR